MGHIRLILSCTICLSVVVGCSIANRTVGFGTVKYTKVKDISAKQFVEEYGVKWETTGAVIDGEQVFLPIVRDTEQTTSRIFPTILLKKPDGSYEVFNRSN